MGTSGINVEIAKQQSYDLYTVLDKLSEELIFPKMRRENTRRSTFSRQHFGNSRSSVFPQGGSIRGYDRCDSTMTLTESEFDKVFGNLCQTCLTLTNRLAGLVGGGGTANTEKNWRK